jgi:hypothetical protein
MVFFTASDSILVQVAGAIRTVVVVSVVVVWFQLVELLLTGPVVFVDSTREVVTEAEAEIVVDSLVELEEEELLFCLLLEEVVVVFT